MIYPIRGNIFLHSVYTPQVSTLASSFLCGFAGNRPAFKSGHQQYLKNGENTDKLNVFSIFLCGGICMYMYVRYRVR